MTLKLNGSSSGYTAIDAPAAAGSNTLVLPTTNGTAGQVLQTDGSGNLSWVTLPTYNDVIDTWRLNALNTGDQDPITANWEREDDQASSLYGSGESEGSGVFTFPKSGYYLITFHHQFNISGNERYAETYIISSTNGSNWNNAARGGSNITQVDSANTMGSCHIDWVFDVQDTNHAVRFAVYYSNNSVTTHGNTDMNTTYASFLRLRDT